LTVEEVRMGAEQQIAEALSPAVQAAGLEIWDVERSGASVRVLVERAGGVDLDSISRVSAAVSAVLDQRDDLVPAGRYMLEVSSPGLERRLRYPSHFAQYLGEEVTVRTVEALNGTRRLRGTLTAVTDESITVRAESPGPGPGPEELTVPLRSIERANAVFAWGEAAKAPQRSKGPRSRKEPGVNGSGKQPAHADEQSSAPAGISGGDLPGGVG
jgi:ribosome maturation factor RimP